MRGVFTARVGKSILASVIEVIAQHCRRVQKLGVEAPLRVARVTALLISITGP